jgi:predicted nucleic acid-binding protein
MILFCDTSALVKLYVSETNSSLVTDQLKKAEAVAVSRITWAEAQAAFARRVRENPRDAETIERAKAAFAVDWSHFVKFEVSQELVELAGDYADTFALRGYDSVQLASAHETARITQTTVLFACFDLRLNKAAKALGLQCL